MKLKLCLLLVFIVTYSWSQGSTKTFTGNGTFPVPAGVTNVTVEAWGGGGSGGGASGAPLLLGRGAAGGGGGAYARNNIVVTPGATLNVVVASQTTGTTGAGTAGGNSTITGFESSILAAGGSGGDANNAGGSPLGGIGGTVAASAGTTKLAGTNGGNGNSWNLLGLLLSSGAGGAGANFGGAGGTAVSGLILSNAPGNAGSPAGGGGSGAINSALGASQIGGAGAAGRVAITYSCANFSLTSTAATNVCGSTGTTSTVTLTGSASSLPVGNYEVTYNRSSPSATALTANLTVSTAGTGTFTAVGLTTGGSSTITITKLTSESCSSNITANNTATVTVSPATVGGTVNGGITVCSGSTSGFLTLSGNTGSVVKWQSSVSPFSTWSDIANTTTTYTSGALTETTQFRAVVQSGACAAVNSAATTVTVSPATVGGTVNGGITVCSGSTSGFLTLSGHTGSVVKWQSSVSPFSTWTDIANTTTTYASGALTETTQFRAVVQSGACAAVNSAATTVTVSPATVGGTVNGGITVCSGSTSGFLTLSGHTGSVIKWQSSVSPFSTWSDIANTTTTYTSGALTETTQFRAVIQSSPCTPINSAATTVTVSPTTVGGTVSGGTAINSGDTSGLLTLSGHIGSVIKWQSSISPFSTWSDIANTTTTYTSGVLTETTQFRAVVQSGVCAIANSDPTTVTVNPKPTIVLDSSATDICSDIDGIGQSTTLSYSSTTENPITYSIVWNASPSNSFAAVTDAVLPPSPITILVPGGTAAGIYTGTLTVKNTNGTVSLGSVFTLKVKQTASIISNDIVAPVNTSTSVQYTTLAYSGVIGNPTGYSLLWDQPIMQFQTFDSFTFSPSGGVINNIKVPANVPAGTYTGTMNFYSDGCYGSHHVSIIISNPSPTITLASAAQTRCSTDDGSASTTTLEYTATTENPTTYSIVWDSSPANTFVAVTDAALPANPIEIAIPAEVIPGTYTGTLTVKNANGAVSSPGSSFTVTINETPLITTWGIIDAVCSSTNPQNGVLTFTDFEGNPTDYSIDWDGDANAASLADQSSTPFDIDPNGSITTIQIPANVPPGTYSGIISVSNGVCSQSQPVSITINSSPSINLSAAAQTVCQETEDQYTPLLYNGATDSPVTYSIVWDSSPTNNFVAVTDDELFDITINVLVPANTTPGTYTGTLTVKNANGCISPGYAFSVTVNTQPTITTTGTIAPVSTSSSIQNSTLAYTASTNISSGTYIIDWDEDLFTDQSETSSTFVSGGGVINNVEIPANIPAGTYFGTMFIFDESCSINQPVSITINPVELPTITTAPASTICLQTGNSTADTYTVLSYSATTGSPVTYSIAWDSSPANNLVPVTDAVLPSNPKLIFIAIASGTDLGIYTGTITVKDANGISSVGSTFNLKIGNIPTINTSGTINSVATSNNSQNAALAYSSTNGSPSSYSIDWNSAANTALLVDQSSTPFVFNSSGGIIDNIVIPANVPAGTYSGVMNILNSTSCDESQNISITINPVEDPTITLTNDLIEYCSSPFASNLSLAYSGTTGSPTTYSIVWNSSPPNSFAAVTDAALPASPIPFVVPAGTASGTYTGTLTVKNASGLVSPDVTFSVKLYTLPTIALSGPATPVTTSTNLQYTSVSYNIINGSPIEYYIDWNATANAALLSDQGVTPNVFPASGSGTINTIEIPANVPAGTYSGRLYVRTGSVCTGSYNINITINPVVVAPVITLASSEIKYCLDNYTYAHYKAVPYSATGNPVTYSIVWDSSPANSFTAVTDTALPASAIQVLIPVGTASDTYTGTLTVKNANGDVSDPSTFTIKVGRYFTFNSTGSIAPVCTSNSLQNTTLAYSSITGAGHVTSYSIDWDSAANTALLADQGDTPYTSIASGGDIDGIQIPANVPAGTYNGTIFLFDGTCSTTKPVSIVINQSSTAPIIGQVINANNSHPGSVALSGLPSGNWVIVNNLDQVESGSGTSTIFTVDGGMTYTFTVTPEGGCPSPESEPVFVGFQFGGPISKETPSVGATDPESAKNTISVAIDNKVINVEAPNQIINEVFVFDVSGNLLYQKNRVSDSKLVITDLRSSNQVLVVRVVLNNKHSEIKKVIY